MTKRKREIDFDDLTKVALLIRGRSAKERLPRKKKKD
jgi:hypothetical protein